MMNNLDKIVESTRFEKFITIIIILNAITLGLETNQSLSAQGLNILLFLDKSFLAIFVVEILMKMAVFRKKYFHEPWRVFDFIALLPASGPFSVLRSLRVLRTLRMLSVVPSLKKVISGLIVALPGLGAVLAIIGLIFYVGAVMATKLFGSQFPDWFGTIWHSSYSLFQIMTLESWSMGIVRPVMEYYPYAWLFFLPFILITTFTMLNLFIAVIVNAMQAETDANAEERAEQGHSERVKIFREIELINKKLDSMITRK
jgi:voltage-gated sodium channel